MNLFRTAKGQFEIACRSLVRLLDESVQEHHHGPCCREQHTSNPSVDRASYFPKPWIHLAYQRHAQWPTKLHCLDVFTDDLACIWWQGPQQSQLARALGPWRRSELRVHAERGTVTVYLNLYINSRAHTDGAHLSGGVVPVEGIEPTLCCQNWILSPARLPIPPHRLSVIWMRAGGGIAG